MVQMHLLARREFASRRSLWLFEENMVGVAEFNSSVGRLERSMYGSGEGDTEEQLRVKKEKKRSEPPAFPVAAPGG